MRKSLRGALGVGVFAAVVAVAVTLLIRRPHQNDSSLTCRPLAEPPPGLLVPGAMVVLGEIHGTEQMPRRVAELACAAAKSGKGVVIALELPVTEGAELRKFVHGETDSPSNVLATPYWTDTFQAGVTSVAMLDLIIEARRMRREGAKIDIVPFRPAVKTSRPFEEVMAENIASAAEAHPDSVLIALTGNTHARRGDSEPKRMGWYLSKRVPSMVSLNVSHAGGTAWVCMGSPMPQCGVRPIGLGEAGSARAPIELCATPDGDFDGTIYIGRISASPPAVGASSVP